MCGAGAGRKRNSDGKPMNCPWKFLAAGLALSLAGAVLSLPISAQTPQSGPGAAQPAGQELPPPSQDPRARIRTTVSLVVVPVTVKDRNGDLVTDLEEGEFRIYEDGVQQRISLFSVEGFPLSAAVLIDDDLGRSSAERVQKSLQVISGGFSASDEVSLWRFDEFPTAVSNFITDNDALLTQLKRVDLNSSFPGVGSAPMTGGPRVNTQRQPGPLEQPSISIGHPNNKHIDDAIYAAAEQLRDRPRERRKIILLISDGQNAKNNTHSYDETLKMLLSSGISVYALGVGGAHLNRGVNILARYAHATGGDIFYGSSQEDLEHLYSRACVQARYQYTLGYVPTQTDRTRLYHSIEVRVERPGLLLLTRDGYYLSDKP
jgi:VWFA-related protein